MNKDKLNEIGAKLNVDASSVKQRKEQQLITKPLYILIQIVIFGISAVIGYGLAAMKEHAAYPISFFVSSIPISLLVFTLHAGNGFLTIPGQEKYGVRKSTRISVFLVNILVSLIVIQQFLCTAAPYPSGVRYGVLDLSSQTDKYNPDILISKMHS